MKNFFVTYDLNGPTPSHKQMDDHIRANSAQFGRVLETVWFVQSSAGSARQLRETFSSILGKEDLLLVIEASDAAWTGLLLDSNSLITAWQQAA